MINQQHPYYTDEEFRKGYDAACVYHSRNPSNSTSWLKGYDEAKIDLSKG